MVIALTGATGFVGRHVTALLARRGYRLRALARHPDRVGSLGGPALELVPGDLANPTALATLVRGADAVIHLVGIIVEARGATFREVHVEGTRRVIAAAREAGVRRFVHMSAIGARAAPGATPYHRTKWAAEELVRSAGLPYAILRPSIISGPENAPIRLLARLHRWAPVVPVFGHARFPTQPVWIEDVALAVARAVEDRAIVGAFELGGPSVLSYEEFVLAIGRAAHHPRALLHVPLSLARAVARGFDVLGRAAPFTRDQLQMLVEGSATPANAIATVFGLTPLAFEEGLRRFLGPQGPRRG
ncbi:MAG TPA: complex I NDUFA9 subunit family protein [Gemmatimonadales bacterium]|nr:complex I NDUFA9 subunit family protein [Gemmatimonadales bacterium]